MGIEITKPWETQKYDIAASNSYVRKGTVEIMAMG
jgi:hypothetical protein